MTRLLDYSGAALLGIKEANPWRKKKKPAAAKPDVVMPDEEQLKLAARRRQSALAGRSGRVSTILDQETLG
jgi:hypothetical protein